MRQLRRAPGPHQPRPPGRPPAREGITSTAIDTRANAVVVGSSVVTDALRAELARKYGDGIVLAFEPPSQGGDACTSRSNCPPAKAGIKIDTSRGKYCTTGPMVRVAGSGALRVLTAGHCVELTGGTGTSRKWTHHGAGFGWSEFHTWADGADADVGLLNPSSYPVSGARNLMYRGGSADVVGIRSWKPTDEQVQGSLVCRAGAISGYVCGEITLTNKTKDVDGRAIDHQWVVDFDACPGDSGAPYVLGDVAWGIHSDSTAGCNPNTNQAWYSPMGWVFDVLAQQGHPVELCTNPACTGANSWTTRGSLDGAAWGPRARHPHRRPRPAGRRRHRQRRTRAECLGRAGRRDLRSGERFVVQRRALRRGARTRAPGSSRPACRTAASSSAAASR